LKLARCPRSLGAARRAFAFYLGNPFSSVPYSFSDFLMRFRETIPVDDYVLDVLMRDLVGHDQQPAAIWFIFIFMARPRGRNGNLSPLVYERLPTRQVFPKAPSKPPLERCSAAN